NSLAASSYRSQFYQATVSVAPSFSSPYESPKGVALEENVTPIEVALSSGLKNYFPLLIRIVAFSIRSLQCGQFFPTSQGYSGFILTISPLIPNSKTILVPHTARNFRIV